MSVVGVVAEYNPFHRGHLYHLTETRRRCPGALVVVCMSGNWVQRAQCAVTDKWTRARWAVMGGADLVLELPTPFALSSAEGFARGAVSILAAAGADALSFGCETADLPALAALAQALDSPEFPQALSPFLGRGLTFPAARLQAVQTLVGQETAGLLASPNNNLAVEYLRAKPAAMDAVAVRREGRHDGPLTDPYPSAAALRELLARGDPAALRPHLPQEWEGPLYQMETGDRAILARLRRLAPQDWSAIPDSGDGLAQRLGEAVREAVSFDDLCQRAKSRHLTLSRVRRVALWAFLGLTAADRPTAPGYLRVLAMGPRGQAHLAALKGSCPLPIITKPAQFSDLLARESVLTDLFSLFAPQPLPCGQEFLHSPVVL